MDDSTESLELSSSSEIHPNIDEKSYKNWKRQARKHERENLKNRLEILKTKNNLTETELNEKEEIKNKLKTDYKIKNENTFRTEGDNLNTKEIDIGDILVDLLENQSLEYFSETISKNRNCLNSLEELILYNLSENIKEGNDEVGITLSRMCLLLGYFNTHGKNMLDKLIEEIKIPEKKKAFSEDVEKYYKESKDAILSLRNENTN